MTFLLAKFSKNNFCTIAVFVAAFCIAAIINVNHSWAQEGFSTQPLTIITNDSSLQFNIEIADTEDKRSKGLMFRRSMGAHEGMLFAYDAPREITMWMRNTYISLDMIFISQDNKIVSIAPRAKPHSMSIISSRVPAQYVLEINGGLAKQLGIQLGQEVIHPILEKSQ